MLEPRPPLGAIKGRKTKMAVADRSPRLHPGEQFHAEAANSETLLEPHYFLARSFVGQLLVGVRRPGGGATSGSRHLLDHVCVNLETTRNVVNRILRPNYSL